MSTTPEQPHAFQDLIDEVDKRQASTTKKSRAPRQSITVEDLVARIRTRLVGTPERKARTKKIATIAGPIAAIGLGLGLYFWLRPMPQPDYRKDDVRRVLTYTLLTEEFNKLPVEKRIELIGQLVQRFNSMSSGDSVLMAAFAGSITGKARAQLQENAARLAIDLWDKYAVDYSKVPPEKQGEFLDQALLEMTKLMEATGGRPRDVSDEQRLAEIRSQSQRDTQRAGQNPSPRMQARMLSFVRDNFASQASPLQQARGQLMMRDMTRHLNRGG